ncbi:acyltransferase [Marinobacter flavimaris]|jgi:acetyltransferase-like isoleucine patch superfamily enzyme|uniref:Acyltransferase n=1 Tax=Marinobacter flavimaris TaxID=262076 RepID=A0A3D8H7T3_9GAMM|nr:acyltransferase [Marinobacter flavimaris]PPI79371.1 acetyltransferase [Marinobacter flavimaris]RDU42783.1 acyltransferase [Marinobacter flavimaris]
MSLRSTLKRSLKNLFLVLVFPLFALYWLLSKGGRSDGIFQSFSQFLSLFPGKTGIYLRAAFYRLACPGTSDDISIGFLTVFSHRNTTIQSGVYIGPQCNIGKCTIEENTLLGSGVHVLSGSRQHEFDSSVVPIQQQGGRFEKISIGSDCWLGNTAVVMASMATKTIVAAGSVVTKEFTEGDILAGNPAKPLRNRLHTPSVEQVEGFLHDK